MTVRVNRHLNWNSVGHVVSDWYLNRYRNLLDNFVMNCLDGHLYRCHVRLNGGSTSMVLGTAVCSS